jgi:hypothetical protein
MEEIFGMFLERSGTLTTSTKAQMICESSDHGNIEETRAAPGQLRLRSLKQLNPMGNIGELYRPKDSDRQTKTRVNAEEQHENLKAWRISESHVTNFLPASWPAGMIDILDRDTDAGSRGLAYSIR